MGEDLFKQIMFNAHPIMIAGIVIMFLGFIPGLPFFPFLLIGGIFAFVGRQIKNFKKIEEEAERQKKVEQESVPPPPEKIESLLKVDLLGLEIGYSLIQLVDTKQGGNLLQRIKGMRKQLALELGIVVPPVRIRDNLQLGGKDYSILIKGVQVIKGEVMPSGYMAINPGNVSKGLKGIKTKEPAFGLEAYWISEEEKEEAQLTGYTIVDPATVITTHLTEVVKKNAAELLGRQETQHLIDNLSSLYPKIAEELIPGLMTLGNVQKVLHNLLRERVSIIDLRTILETLADYAPVVKDISMLTEFVRQALSRSLVKPYVTGNNDLPVLVLGSEMESFLNSRLEKSGDFYQMMLQPQEAQEIISKIKEGIQKAGLKVQPILLCSSSVRPHLRQVLERFIEDLVIVSASEIPRNVKVVSLGVIE